MPALQDLKAFDVANADVHLWVFKKSQRDGALVLTGRWIPVSPELATALKDTVNGERERITEVIQYSLLAQNNEASALQIGTADTNAPIIVAAAGDPTDKKKVSKVKDLLNTAFYAIKLIAGGNVLYGVKKTDSSWLTRRQKGVLNVVFSDETLTIDEESRFVISRYLDFFILENDVLVSKKENFESVLNHKKEHIADFIALKAEPQFSGIFSEIGPLESYVSDNKIQLRRASVIKVKGHYKDPAFMQRLRERHVQYKLNLTFDGQGRLVPTEANCPHIFQALLDHRLTSGFSENIYDVQDAANVA